MASSPEPSPGRRRSTSSDTAEAERILGVVKDSFASGVQLSLRVIAAIALVGLVIAIRGIRVPRSQAPA